MSEKDYWNNIRKTPEVEVCVASTNEPVLKGSVGAWAEQTHSNYHVYIVNDCTTVEGATDLAPYIHNPNISITMNPHLQGLRRIWNNFANTTDAEFICFAAGDIVFHPRFLEVGVGVLKKHPEYGIVCPAVYGKPDDVPLWAYLIHKDTWKKVGELDPAFGMGGIGMIRDWIRRAISTGYSPAILRDITMSPTDYSIQDKAPSLEVMEGGDSFKKKYGIDIMNTIYHDPPFQFVDNDGDLCGRFYRNDKYDNPEHKVITDVYLAELSAIQMKMRNEFLNSANLEDKLLLLEDLEVRATTGCAAAFILIEAWANTPQAAFDKPGMDEQMETVKHALNRIFNALVSQRIAMKIARDTGLVVK